MSHLHDQLIIDRHEEATDVRTIATAVVRLLDRRPMRDGAAETLDLERETRLHHRSADRSGDKGLKTVEGTTGIRADLLPLPHRM